MNDCSVPATHPSHSFLDKARSDVASSLTLFSALHRNESGFGPAMDVGVQKPEHSNRPLLFYLDKVTRKADKVPDKERR